MKKPIQGTISRLQEHLGDGVYALFDGYGIWLHANDHADPTDRIYLEPEVFAALTRFNDKAEAMKKAQAEKNPVKDSEMPF